MSMWYNDFAFHVSNHVGICQMPKWFRKTESISTKCLFLNDEPCMVRPTLIDINPNELKYYRFMISLNKCAGSCNV